MQEGPLQTEQEEILEEMVGGSEPFLLPGAAPPCFFSFFFLGPHQRHMEVPRLGAELEL